MDSKTENGVRMYSVAWTSTTTRSWEPEDHLINQLGHEAFQDLVRDMA